MHLEILTPEKKIFEGEVSSATFPGADGSFQILNHHAPLVSLLKEGSVEYKTGKDGKQSLVITGGVVEVLRDHVILLADGVKQ
ncbi:MAG: ATP synthase F1 subunit epsilon [Cyclobacteriaceae bacterium]